jgi:hypothetical protein
MIGCGVGPPPDFSVVNHGPLGTRRYGTFFRQPFPLGCSVGVPTAAAERRFLYNVDCVFLFLFAADAEGLADRRKWRY